MAAMSGCQVAFSTVGSWTREAPPPAPITTNNVVALADGRVAVFGGIAGGQWSNQTDLYNPSTRSWGTGAPMPGPVPPDVVTPLRDGTVLVEGGQPLSGATWIYDPTRDSWSRAGDVIEPREFPSFALLGDGRLLIAGGSLPLDQPQQTSNGQIDFMPVASAEIYDPTTRRWSQAGRLVSPRDGISLAAVGGGGAVAAGGCLGTPGFAQPLTESEAFDPTANVWTPTVPLPAGICAGDGIGLRDGRAMVVDQNEFVGARAFFNSTDSAYVYDPKARSWSLSSGLAGGGTAALMLTDGRVLIPELQQGAQQGRVFTEMVGGQVFDPASNEWTYASTTAVRLPISYMFSDGAQVAVSLPDGTVLFILKTVTLAFHPQEAPPAAEVLDSSGLTVELLVVLAVIALLLLLAYRRAARTDLGKLQ